jgi:hypothetical protein
MKSLMTLLGFVSTGESARREVHAIAKKPRVLMFSWPKGERWLERSAELRIRSYKPSLEGIETFMMYPDMSVV